MYGRGRNHHNSSYSQPSEDEHDEYSSSTSSLVMLVVHNLDHMMQPHEWETLLTREIHGARILGVVVIREQSSSRPWGEGELTAYIFTRHDAQIIRQYLHNRRLGFRRLNVDAVSSENGIDAFLVHKVLQLLKLNPQMSDIAIEQRISSFFRRIPSSIRPRDYDRSSVIRLIHECLGLPASPPATSEDSEVDSDSPPRSSNVVNQSASSTVHHSIPIQVAEPAAPAPFNPQLIRIDERTMQLHFTPLYFELLDAMATIKPNPNDLNQLIENELF